LVFGMYMHLVHSYAKNFVIQKALRTASPSAVKNEPRYLGVLYGCIFVGGLCEAKQHTSKCKTKVDPDV